MGDPVTAAAVTAGGSLVGKGADMLMQENQNKSQENIRRENKANSLDEQNRQEANYRYDRQMIMNALGSYYKQQGWQMPDPSTQLPGYGTRHQLPSENPLYSGTSQEPNYKNNGQGPATVNPQPTLQTKAQTPTMQDSTLPTDGTDGSKSSNSPAQTNPNAQTSGFAQNNAPTQNSQQNAASVISSLLRGSKDDARKAYMLRGSDGDNG